MMTFDMTVPTTPFAALQVETFENAVGGVVEDPCKGTKWTEYESFDARLRQHYVQGINFLELLVCALTIEGCVHFSV
jgi:hypothetical protein